MRKLLFFLSLIPFIANAQVWQQNNLEYGHQFKGLKATRALLAPLVQTTAGQGRDTGAVYYRIADSAIYVWTGFQWRQIAGGSSSADSSVFATRYYTQQTFVPYTGATSSPNLGANGLTTDRFVFNQTPTLAGGERIMRWNDTDGTLDVGLKGGNVTLQVGQEQHNRARNNTGSTILNGQVVYISGSTGTNTTIALARANASSTSKATIGIATEDISNGQSGFVTTFGKVRDINTSSLTEGGLVYLSSTTAGGFTSTAPTGDTYPIVIGVCERSHATQGVIFVHIDKEYVRQYEIDTAKANIRSEIGGGGSADSTFVVMTADTIRSGTMAQFVATDSLIAFGTSIAVPTAPTFAERGYAHLVGSMLRLRKLITGLSGYSMQTTGTYPGNSFYSIHTSQIKQKTAAAKFIMFEFGINDASYDEDNPAFNFDTTNYKTQYLEVLAYAVSKGWTYPEMIIVSPEFHESTSISMQNDYFNCTKKFADSLGCFFADVYTNGMNYYISVDGTHPADYGHQRIANIIVQRLNSVNNVKLNGQNLAVDGIAEVKKLYIRQTDTTSSTGNILTIDSDGLVTKSPYDFIPRFFKTIPSIRQSGHLFYEGKLDLTQTINTASGLRVQAGLNDFSTGSGFQLAYFNNSGVLFPHNYGTSTSGNVVVPGGRFLVGGYTSTGFSEGIYSSSGIASTYGVFSAQPAFTNTTQSLTLGVFGGAGFIATFGTSGSYLPTALNPLNNSAGNILIGTTTYNSASSLAVNGKSFFGSAGAASAWVHMAAGTASANTAPLKFTTGTNLTTAEAGAMEYTTPKLYFTNGTAIRQEIPLIQQSRVSTQFDATSNTTLANITGLTANVAASGVYRFEAILYTTSANTGGVKVAIAGTATATAIIYEGLTTDAGLTTQSRATALGTAVGAVTAVTAGYIKITGTITVNAAGTLTVQFAQNASDATASSVLVGSVFVLTQIN